MFGRSKPKPTHRICFHDGTAHREIGVVWQQANRKNFTIELFALPINRGPENGTLRLAAFKKS